MVWIDYLVIFVITFSSFFGLIRGFVREALSLIIWSCIFFVPVQLYDYLAIYLTRFNDPITKNFVAIAIILFMTIIIGGAVNYLMGLLVKRLGLSGIDRLIGIFFGALRGILISLVILFFLYTFTPLSNSEDWKRSELIDQFDYIIEWFFDYLRNTLTFFPEENIQIG